MNGVTLSPDPSGTNKFLRSATDPAAAWDRWELQQWVEATRSRGLRFLALDVDVQRRIVAAIDQRPQLA